MLLINDWQKVKILILDHYCFQNFQGPKAYVVRWYDMYPLFC